MRIEINTPALFDRLKFLNLIEKVQKYSSPFFAALAFFSCFTNGGLNIFTGVVNLSWFAMMCSLFLTTVWNSLNILFALFISPDYFAQMYENPSITNKFKAYSNFFYHLLGMLPATVLATYTIVKQTDEQEPIPSAISDAAFGGGEILVALYAFQKLTHSKESNESIQALSTVITSLFCAAGAAFGSDSMLSKSRWPLYSSAGFFGAWTVFNFAGEKIVTACLSKKDPANKPLINSV